MPLYATAVYNIIVNGSIKGDVSWSQVDEHTLIEYYAPSSLILIDETKGTNIYSTISGSDTRVEIDIRI